MGDEHDSKIIRRFGHEVAQESQDVQRLLQRPVHRSTQDERSDGVQIVSEGGRNAEIAAATAETPEQLGRALGVDTQLPSVSGDQVDGMNVVDRESVAPEQVAEPTVQGEATDSHLTDRAAGRGQPVSLGCKIKFAPGHPGRRSRLPRCRIHRYALHQGEIDHDRAVGYRVASDPVSTSAYGDRQLVIAGKRSIAKASSASTQRPINAGRRSTAPFRSAGFFDASASGWIARRGSRSQVAERGRFARIWGVPHGSHTAGI
jgi:hypothetical protein